jgi:pimeloyl-ACP methyl ester carboxylesterase
MNLRVLPACVVLLAGCQDFLAQRAVAPPNGGRSLAAAARPPLDKGEMRIPVGPPQALLAAWVLEPKTPPRGTVLLLHGFIADHHQMEAPARVLRDAGYRAVLVDLRGHGHSTGEYLTFGVNDARDLAQVTTYLQTHQLCGDSVGVLGASYGAASAILFAGSDPRVKAVFAVAPYATLRQEAPYFGKHLVPVPGLFMSAQDFTQVVNRMGQIADFDPDACSPVTAIRQTSAHVRLLHGTADMIVPCDSSRELAAAAPDRTELELLPLKGHLEMCLDPLGTWREEAREWFDKYLGTEVARGQ